MTMYVPDRWCLVQIGDVYKVFGSWYGGYLGSDSWRLNSVITSVTKESDRYTFEGASGSKYVCCANHYGFHSYGAGVLEQLKTKVSVSFTVLTEQQAMELIKLNSWESAE